ncbi:MAG: hypothetical protein ACO3DR_00440 [Ilumatobacteraceae bacterium]
MSGAAMGTQILPGWGTAIGAVIGGVAGYFGSKGAKAPDQAQYTPVDPAAVQRQVLGGNAANLAAAQDLASRTNTFNQSESRRLLEQAIPGFSRTQQRMLAQIDEDLMSSNTLPKDVQAQIARFAAEKGVTRGTSGNFNGFNLVKDFGFNLTDWKNASRARALNTLSTVYGMAPRVNPMSPMAMMVDPSTAIGVQTQNNMMGYNVAQAGFNAQASASNYNTMMSNGLWQNFMTQLPGQIADIKAGFSGATVKSKVLVAPDAQGNTMEPYIVR